MVGFRFLRGERDGETEGAAAWGSGRDVDGGGEVRVEGDGVGSGDGEPWGGCGVGGFLERVEVAGGAGEGDADGVAGPCGGEVLDGGVEGDVGADVEPDEFVVAGVGGGDEGCLGVWAEGPEDGAVEDGEAGARGEDVIDAEVLGEVGGVGGVVRVAGG